MSQKDMARVNAALTDLNEAVKMYRRIADTERRLATQRGLLEDLLSAVPWDQIPAYMRATQED